MATEPTYLLTFANVPFVADQAQRIGRESPNKNTRKYRTDGDPLEELERVAPTSYARDYVYPGVDPTPEANCLPDSGRADPPSTCPYYGEWYYPPGARRWSVFRGLATSSEVQEMLSATSGNSPSAFTMKVFPPELGEGLTEADYTLSSSMYMLPPRPLAEHGGDEPADGLFVVTLVDERYWWQDTPVTLNITATTTWASLVSTIATALNAPITISGTVAAAYLTPEADSQLWSFAGDAAQLLDAIAANIGRVVVRKLNGTYTLETATVSSGLVNSNRGLASSVVRAAGGSFFDNSTKMLSGDLRPARNAVIPANVVVAFPKYVTADPIPHFLNPRYASPRPSAQYEGGLADVHKITVSIGSLSTLINGLSGVAIGQHVIHDTAKATYATETAATGSPTNLSMLQSLAEQVATDYYDWKMAQGLDETYPGTFAWEPEGFHDIIWTYSDKRQGGFTRVVRAGWNDPPQHLQHSSGAVKGVGGYSVAQTIRDSAAAVVSTTLTAGVDATALSFTVADVNHLPTRNRWKGQVGNEIILFEGTAGSSTLTAVQRGADGTTAAAHASGTLTWSVPDTTYGVNLVTFEQGMFAFPSDFKAGGIQGVTIVPQTQTVMATSATAQTVGSLSVFPGRVIRYDENNNGTLGEAIWLVERNTGTLTISREYDGQLIGFSSAPALPVYLVNDPVGDPSFPSTITNIVNNTIINVSAVPLTRSLTTYSPMSIDGVFGGTKDLSQDRSLGVGGLTGFGQGNDLVGMLPGPVQGWEYKTAKGQGATSVTFGVGTMLITSTDENIKVTAADTTAGKLSNKTAAGTGITLAVLNPGANEKLQISATDNVYSGVRSYKCVNQDVTAGTAATVLFERDDNDTASYHSTAALADTFTFPAAGVHAAGGTVTVQVPTGGATLVELELQLNGGNTILDYDRLEAAIGASAYVTLKVNSGPWNFAQDDFVRARVKITGSGAALVMAADPANSTSQWSNFWAYRLGPTASGAEASGDCPNLLWWCIYNIPVPYPFYGTKAEATTEAARVGGNVTGGVTDLATLVCGTTTSACLIVSPCCKDGAPRTINLVVTNCAGGNGTLTLVYFPTLGFWYGTGTLGSKAYVVRLNCVSVTGGGYTWDSLVNIDNTVYRLDASVLTSAVCAPFSVIFTRTITDCAGASVTFTFTAPPCDDVKRIWCLRTSPAQCYTGTEAEAVAQATLLGVLKSGPYATAELCQNDNCPPGTPVTTACCPGQPTPQTLFATFSLGTGACSCANAVAVTLTYNAVTDKWEGSGNLCGEAVTYQFWCYSAPSWAFAIVSSCGTNTTTNIASSCSPFSWSFSMPVSCDIGTCPFGDSFTIVVTE